MISCEFTNASGPHVDNRRQLHAGFPALGAHFTFDDSSGTKQNWDLRYDLDACLSQEFVQVHRNELPVVLPFVQADQAINQRSAKSIVRQVVVDDDDHAVSFRDSQHFT